MSIKFLCSVALILCCGVLRAQEINCKVKILHDKIVNVDDEVFKTMERSITEFINTRKWTTDNFQPNEKIDMILMLNLVSKTDKDKDEYNANLTIQATRPVYNTSYTSPLINFIDRDVSFAYNQFTPILYDDNRVAGSDAMAANLPAIIAYYIYLSIGLDYDSYSEFGGTAYFKKAQNIVNNAPEASKKITGWKAAENNGKNRFWLMDQMLHPRFQELRKYWYTYHRLALDSMSYNQKIPATKIANGIRTLTELNRTNPSSFYMQFFMNAKNNEIFKVLANMPLEERKPFIPLMSQLDVPNAARYNELLK